MNKFHVRTLASIGSVSMIMLMSGCGSNPQQLANVASAMQTGAANSGGNKTQLAAGVAQAALAGSASGPGASALPEKMSCKDISGRLIKARSGTAGAAPAMGGAADNKLAMAAGAASLVGNLSGNSQLAGIGSQLGAVSGGAVQDGGVSELQARASAQGCKLPLEAQVSPAVSKMSCKAMQTEWQAGNAPAAPATAGLLGRGGAQDKVAMAGAAASLAGALTGNKELAKVGEMAGQATGSAPSAGSSNYARDELQIAAKARNCKLPGVASAAENQPMSCAAIKQELKSLPAGGAALAMPDNKLAQGAQAVGMLATVAGALSGNEGMKAVGQQASALSGSGGDAGGRRAALEAQAKTQRCKI